MALRDDTWTPAAAMLYAAANTTKPYATTVAAQLNTAAAVLP